jgi:hypothetical protein
MAEYDHRRRDEAERIETAVFVNHRRPLMRRRLSALARSVLIAQKNRLADAHLEADFPAAARAQDHEVIFELQEKILQAPR